MWSRTQGTTVSMPATKTGGLFKAQQHAMEIREGILKGMERVQAKTENLKIVLNGPRKVNAREGRFVQLQAPDGRRDTKGQEPKGASPSGKMNQAGVLPLQTGQWKTPFRMLLLAPTSMFPVQNKKCLQNSGQAKPVMTDITAGGNVTIVMKLHEAPELNFVGKDKICVFSTIFSNKGTVGMESSVVLFKPHSHLFACTHPSVSNSLDYNDWLAYKHQSIACVQTRLDCGSLLYTSISFHPVFQTCLDCGSLSAHTHQYPALCFKYV